jgi:hypothetical protein
MKIASSSASFAAALADGSLNQLEWLDLCAAELELDGVLFDRRHFPRDDADYLAELKKMAVDLGLSVAGLFAGDLLADGGTRRLDEAAALGAPLVVFDAPPASDAETAWSAFTEALKPLTMAAKRANIVLALRNGPASLCAKVADCKRLAKDIDSAWLRFALDATTLGAFERTDALLEKTVIATHAIGNTATFARDDDPEARALLASLAGFRGFVVVDRGAGGGERDAYHHAILRLRALAARSAIERSDDDHTAVCMPG